MNTVVKSVKIKSVKGLQILDSRGNPTLSVRVELADGSVGVSGVPSGASTGEYEAIELRDGDARYYRGKGVQKAVASVNGEIAGELVGKDASSLAEIDSLLIDLDGTDNKARLGANAVVGTSIAVAYAAAASNRMEPYRFLRSQFNQAESIYAAKDAQVVLPVPLVNVMNGGAHADNNLDIQEMMIVPHGAKSFSEAVRMAAETFHTLGTLLYEDGYTTSVGDEGGYAPRLESLEAAFEYLINAIERSGYVPGEQISLALDVAASEFTNKSEENFLYRFTRSGLGEFSSDRMIELYEEWISKYPIVSIEDGLDENDWDGWTKLTAKLGSRVQLVGDDLFVTNCNRIQEGIDLVVGNSVLIKPNQIGSLKETFSAIALAAKSNYTSIISHRSGETADSIIADIAAATNCGQIKTGSMCRGERMAKYNRLLWIESDLGDEGAFVDPFRR